MTLKLRPRETQSEQSEKEVFTGAKSTSHNKDYYKPKSVPCVVCGAKCYPDAKYNLGREKKYCNKMACKVSMTENPQHLSRQIITDVEEALREEGYY